MARAGRTEQRLVTRAQIVLAAAAGESNAQIARWLGICGDTVRKWRRRWCAAPGAASLADANRSGRRPKFTAVQVARVKAMACTPPRDKGLPLSRWSCPELAEQAITDGICGSISPATIRRWLSQDALKPWQYQSWIFITDPDFAVKAQRVLDLYDRTWDGTPLGRNDYVISADEKTSIQARFRSHATPPPAQARQIARQGGLLPRRLPGLPGRLDVHRAKSSAAASTPPASTPSTGWSTQVMTTEPYATARRVFWVVDNGSSHRGQAASTGSRTTGPNCA